MKTLMENLEMVISGLNNPKFISSFQSPAIREFKYDMENFRLRLTTSNYQINIRKISPCCYDSDTKNIKILSCIFGKQGRLNIKFQLESINSSCEDIMTQVYIFYKKQLQEFNTPNLDTLKTCLKRHHYSYDYLISKLTEFQMLEMV